MSAPECDIKKKREIRKAKVAFLYYDAIKALENTVFSRVFCYLGRSERTSNNPNFKVSGLTHPTVFGK